MMELDYTEQHWGDKKCPKVDCKKDTCKCGLERVFLSAALGDDKKGSPVAPKNGDYCNAIVVYEANNHIYLYSKDGVPTLIELEGDGFEEKLNELEEGLAQEILDRQAADATLQGEIDDIKNSPDVVDIVPTYAALQAYDTSKLGNNDIVRVLQDETHSGESTYYRWNKNNSTWVFIGSVGDYYTKGQVDTLLSGKQGTLTAGTNIQISPENVISATDTTYTHFTGATSSADGTAGLVPAPVAGDDTKFLSGDGTWQTVSPYTLPIATTTTLGGIVVGSNLTIDPITGVLDATDTTYSAFVGTDGQTAGTAGLVPAPATTDAGKFLKADGTWDTAGGGGPNVVQTTGTSQTDVMSQNATTSMVFADPGTNEKIRISNENSTSIGTNSVRIGRNTNSISTGNYCVSVGDRANATHDNSVAIGQLSGGNSSYITALGNEAKINGITSPYSTSIGTHALVDGSSPYAVAIGAYSRAASEGEVSFGGSTLGTNGYNNTNYRLLTNVYDGQGDHDAVTLGQLNGRVKQNAGAPTTSTVGTVGQLLEDTTNGKLYQCTAVDTTDPNNPSYTWTEVGAGGGGGGPTVVQTTGTSQTDVMSQNAVTSVIWTDPSTKNNISIRGEGGDSSTGSLAVGIGGSSTARGSQSVAIGYNAKIYAAGSYSVAIGNESKTEGKSRSVAIGNAANAAFDNSVAIGTNAKTTRVGEVNVGADTSGRGYNNTNYRVIGGVHDPVETHDAATKGYVDGLIGNCRELTSADYNYDSDGDTVNDTVALWLLPPGVYWWDYSFGSNGGITFTTSTSGTLLNANLVLYSQQVIIGYYGAKNSGFSKIQAFNRSGLVQDANFGWAPFIPYVVNTSTGAVVNFQTDAIPVGRGDVNI